MDWEAAPSKMDSGPFFPHRWPGMFGRFARFGDARHRWGPLANRPAVPGQDARHHSNHWTGDAINLRIQLSWSDRPIFPAEPTNCRSQNQRTVEV